MAKVTPAHIIYAPEGREKQVIDFHAVTVEDHQASAQITKYPVQTGYHVSNHSIRQNRVVTIEAVISNLRLANLITTSGEVTGLDGGIVEGTGIITQSSGDTEYGADSQREVFAALEALVNSGTECQVVTNLDIYEPVVFTKFKTKQVQGMVDSMKFTITGEEIIKIDAQNTAAPTPLTFEVVVGPEREVQVNEMKALGYQVGLCDEVSVATHRVGEDFVIDGVDTAGQAVKTTYIYIGRDPVSGDPMYEIHVSESAVQVSSNEAVDPKNNPCQKVGDGLLGGISQVADCLVEEGTDILVEALEDEIDTAMGKLKQSLYGVFYDITKGSDIGSSMLKAGVGCVVRTITGGGNEDVPYRPGESLPTTDDIITGASDGLGITEPDPELITLTQIQCACTGDEPMDIATDLIPLPF